ncbi:hypothetical protein E4V01_21330 [Methylorubrum sp. Q1]|uniref:hypothetical protein n=1 Tax=Methylorubrum sp. Q1 TaxID=2562453 RepID=UPI0010761AF2|nr:hypothetical protein [Methylorubrum sp. Q1]TFZ55733.1 hypothetical protein E4V01_21330 [Methylorubrum sp. Q1]
MWRQGGIFIRAISAVPREAAGRPLPHTVLAHGELTGHSHRVVDPAALFAGDGCFYLDVRADRARVVHDEHGSIAASTGCGGSANTRRNASSPCRTERRGIDRR